MTTDEHPKKPGGDMSEALRVLLVEESEKDALLILQELKRGGFDPVSQRVETDDAMKSALASSQWDVVISDYALPQFSGTAALRLVMEMGIDIPFIIVSGTIGEETAVAVMKAGAHDCIMKDKLKRLVPAVERELREAATRRKRKRTEDALKESEERFKGLFDDAPVGYHEVDAEGRICRVNRTEYEMLGYAPEEMMGQYIWKFIEEELSRQSVLAKLAGTLPPGESYERTFRRKSGTPLSALVEDRLLRDTQGKITGIRTTIQDINERKQAEEETRLLLTLTQVINEAPSFDSALRMALQTVCESTDWDMGEAWIPRADDSALELSPVWYGRRPGLETFSADGRSFVFPPGKGLPGRVWVSRQPEWLKDVSVDGEIFPRAALALKAGIKSALAVPTLAGDQMLVLVFFMIEAREKEGRLVEVVSAAAAQLGSLFQRKRAEERLRQSESSLRESQIIAGLGSYVLDFSTGKWKSSGILDKIFGIDETYVRSVEGWADLVHPDERQQMLGYFTNEVIGKRVRFDKEYRIIRKNDQAERWVHGAGEPEVDAQNQLSKMHGTITDITERKRAEEKLRQSEQQFRLISENVTDMIAVLDLDGRRLYNSPSYKSLLDDPGLLQGTDSFAEIHPDDRERIMKVFHETVRTGVGQRSEYRLIGKDSGLRFIESQGSVIKNENGNPEKVVVVSRDVTERKRAEQERLVLEEQLRQAQKMESIGTLAGGIAHDFNNILGIILGHSSMFDELVDDPAKLSKSVEAINKAVKRGSGLVRQILTFARNTNVLFEPTRVNDLVTEIEKMLQGTFSKTIEISLQLEKNLPFIEADRTQLHQTLLNLCVNARDAMPGGGTLLIRTSKTTGTKLREQGRDASAAEYVHLCVSDTGIGMDEATKQRIFEPFFTTKELEKGTGLGLSVVYGIVKSHHGYVDVETARGHGTAFHLYFPVPGEPSESENTDGEKNSEVNGGSETILFVEDEEMLRELVSSLLQAKGYKVLIAADGIRGAEVYAQEKEHIALVMTDMGLPKMSGLEMVKRIREVNPAAKVILASGYLPPENKSELEEIGAQEYVEKPYLPDELFRKIRLVLDHRTSLSGV